MTRQQTFNIIIFLLLICGFTSCRQSVKPNNYLVLFSDINQAQFGYKNTAGDTIIPLGKYPRCFTDTFKTYAIVAKPYSGFIAIDRQENILYQVFAYDNGPDYISDGVFRIIENKKLGFAEAATGEVVIKPQFDCAFPFKKGVAKVSINCEIQADGEHNSWISNDWLYINKKGKKVERPL